MGNAFSPSNHHVVAYNNIAQDMFAKKIRPNNKRIWGTAQVMCIKWECMGTPTNIKQDYVIDYVAINTMIIIKLKKTKERTAEAQVNVGQMDMFGLFSQGSSNPSPPPAMQEEAPHGKRSRGKRARGGQQGRL